MNAFLIAVLSSGVALIACSSSTDPGTRRIYSASETASFASSASVPPLADASPYWTPQPSQVRDLEQALLDFMLSEWPADRKTSGRLSEYVRQYFGITRSGKKRILVNAACKSYGEQHPSWKDTFIMVLDGGACFFQLEFDPASHDLGAFNVNGEG